MATKELHPFCQEALNILELHSKSISSTNYDKLKVTLSNLEALLLLGRTASLSDWVILLGGGSNMEFEALLLHNCCKEKAKQNQNEDDQKGYVNQATNSNNHWHLVYENDKDGKCVNGNLEQLIKNVLNGNEVRVVIDNARWGDEAWNAEKIYIRNKIVYATNNTEISLSLGSGTSKMFQSNAYHYYNIINSNGQRDMNRFQCSDGKERGHSQDKIGIKWFIKG